jgi:hypothetical protein
MLRMRFAPQTIPALWRRAVTLGTLDHFRHLARGAPPSGVRVQGEMKRIVIKAGAVAVAAELNNSPTAAAIWRELPISGSATTWGEEIYFPIPVSCDLESSAREVLELGDLGYWPPGRAFCIFFGKTPISAPGEIRAASAVTVVGRVLGDPKSLLEVRDGEAVRLEGIPE